MSLPLPRSPPMPKRSAAPKGRMHSLLGSLRTPKRVVPPAEQVIQPETATAADAPVVLAKMAKPRRGHLVDILGALSHFGLGKERSLIIENLATMLTAGLSLVDSLRTLVLEASSKPAKKLIGRLIERVENGQPLWRAMEEEHFFSRDALALIRIGEEDGSLAENMEHLAAQQEKDRALRGKVTMAMIYPSIVLTLIVVVVLVLGIFVLPNLVQVLYSLNVPLPLVTRIVIAVTEVLSAHGTPIIIGTVVGGILLVIVLKYTFLHVAFQWLLFRIPGVGKLLREATIARFGVILGGLLKAGVPLTDALKSLAEVTTVVAYSRFYTKLFEHISVGDSFTKSFAAIHGSVKLLPPSVQQLVMTGERTGTLSKIMLKIADIYEKKANDTAQRLPIILEPMLLIFIAALVAMIAFAVILPIYSIVGNING